MLDSERIKKLFAALNEELEAMGVTGEVGICGGAVMCLVFQTRQATKDVDAVFHPTKEIRQACHRVAEKWGVEPDWLNDAAKAFFHVDPPRQDVLSFPYLRVWAPVPEYMLAMKCVSARFDSLDRDDTEFLIRHLKLSRPEEVFQIIEKYYPHELVPPKTQFLVEELLSQKPS